MRALSALLAMALVSAPARADLIVVDPQGLPGHDYTELNVALNAASDGDVLLLRSGTYPGPFLVQTKVVSLVAAEGASVQITHPSAALSFLPALRYSGGPGGVGVVRGLGISTSAPSQAIGVAVDSAAGSAATVFLEECTIASAGNVGLLLQNPTPTTVVRCDVEGADGLPGSLPVAPRPAVRAIHGPVILFEGELRGGNGLFSQLPNGQPGFAAEDDPAHSPRVLSGVSAFGGNGADGINVFGSCINPGSGGDGVHASGTAGEVYVVDVDGAGGKRGLAGTDCPNLAKDGQLLGADTFTPPPVVLPGVPAQIELPRVRAQNTLANAVIRGQPGDQVFLLLGPAPAFQLGVEASGVLCVTAVASIPAGTIPASGTLTLAGRAPVLPAGEEAAFLFAQVLTRTPIGDTVLGGASAMLVTQ